MFILSVYCAASTEHAGVIRSAPCTTRVNLVLFTTTLNGSVQVVLYNRCHYVVHYIELLARSHSSGFGRRFIHIFG